MVCDSDFGWSRPCRPARLCAYPISRSAEGTALLKPSILFRNLLAHRSATGFNLVVKFRQARGIFGGLAETCVLITLSKAGHTVLELRIRDGSGKLFGSLGGRLLPAAPCSLLQHTLIPNAGSHLRRFLRAPGKTESADCRKQARNTRRQQSAEDKAEGPLSPFYGRVADSILRPACPRQNFVVLVAAPGLRLPYNGTASPVRVLSEPELMAEIIVNHPFAPEGRHGIHVKHEAAPLRVGLTTARGRGVRFHPSLARNEGFDPGMRIAAADHILRSNVVKLAAGKPVHYARGDSNRTQHDRHGRGEVFAMALAAYE